MKKFRFTLEPLFRYKRTVEKKQQADLSREQGKLRALQRQMDALAARMEDGRQRQQQLLAQQCLASDLEKYGNYLRHLTRESTELQQSIDTQQQAVTAAQQALMVTMKEIKTLSNLREEQYRRYLGELQAEEAKDMSDLVSFQTISGAP